MKRTLLSWRMYLLNLFLEDCKDVQYLGTTFHYSWLIILIAFVVTGGSTKEYLIYGEGSIRRP